MKTQLFCLKTIKLTYASAFRVSLFGLLVLIFCFMQNAS